MLNRHSRIAFASVGILVAVGCGGGGGGIPGINYSTDWTFHAKSPGGLSERVQIFDPGGTQAHAAVIVNQDAAGIQAVNITNIAAGQYRVHVDLNSGRDLTGAFTGSYDTSVNVQGPVNVSTAVGVAPTRLTVVPNAVTITSQQTQQFFVGGYTSAGTGAFIGPTDVQWSASPASIGTMDPNTGLFSAAASASGTASVTAKQVSTGLTGVGSITVTPVIVVHTKWTVLVYMNAANNLFSYSDPNVFQMQSVAANPQVRFVIQWKQYQAENPSSSFDGTRRYLVKPGSNSQNVSQLVQNLGPGVDMGNPQTMQDFINWGKANYPADRYCLVIWDHGNGWRRSFDGRQATRGVSYDDEFSSSINAWQLQQAMGSNHFDIVAWDASLMQMIEVAYEIKDKTSYVVGSEESPPAAGYPYDLVFAKFRDTPDAATLTLSQSFVDGMIAAYGSQQSENITQSVVDTSQLTALTASVSALGKTLVAEQTHLQTVVPAVRTASQSYSLNAPFGRYFYDLYDVSQRLQADSGLTDVATACQLVLTDVGNAVVYEKHNLNSPGSHGISIDFSPSSSFGSYANDYSLLRFGHDTSWGAWLGVAP